MSFEKKMKKRGNDKLNAFAKNPYHKETHKSFPLWGKILIPSLAVSAGLVLFITIGVIPNFFMANGAAKSPGKGEDYNQSAAIPTDNEPGKANYSYAPYSPSDYQGEASVRFDEQTITGQYPYVNLSEEKAYHATNGKNTNPINNIYIGEKISDEITIDGNDNLNGNGHTIKAAIYNIKNISNEAAIAIKFNGRDDYYPYTRITYLVDTYDKLYDQLGFANELVLDSVTYVDNEGKLRNKTINDKDSVAALFASYKGLDNIYPGDPDVPSEGIIESIEIHASLPCLDMNNIRMTFYNYGLLYVQLSFGLPHEFGIGVNAYNTLKATVMSAIE